MCCARLAPQNLRSHEIPQQTRTILCFKWSKCSCSQYYSNINISIHTNIRKQWNKTKKKLTNVFRFPHIIWLHADFIMPFRRNVNGKWRKQSCKSPVSGHVMKSSRFPTNTYRTESVAPIRTGDFCRAEPVMWMNLAEHGILSRGSELNSKFHKLWILPHHSTDVQSIFCW